MDQHLINILSDENDRPPAYENTIKEPDFKPHANMQIKDQTPPPTYEEFTLDRAIAALQESIQK